MRRIWDWWRIARRLWLLDGLWEMPSGSEPIRPGMARFLVGGRLAWGRVVRVNPRTVWVEWRGRIIKRHRRRNWVSPVGAGLRVMT